MQNTFTRLVLLLTLFLSFSCAQKQFYLFSAAENPENTYVKKQNKPAATIAKPEPLPVIRPPQSAPVVYTASAEPELISSSLVITKKHLAQELLTGQPTIPAVTRLVKKQVKLIKAEKVSLKKQDRRADTGKPRNKLAMIGFYLSLGAVVALIVSGAAGVGILGLLSLFGAIGGLVTSKMGLSEINRNPDMYSGKGQALAGLIISIALLALFLIAIIALIAIIRSFQ